MAYRYKVIPFIGRSRGSLSASDVAQQLETMISQHASAGWEFVQLADVNIEVQPGCLGGLLGAKVEYARFDQLIFRSESVTYPLHPETPVIDAATRDRVGSSSSHLHQPERNKAKRPTARYQPERLASGNIKCWTAEPQTTRAKSDVLSATTSFTAVNSSADRIAAGELRHA